MPQFATGPSFMVSPKNGSMVSQEIFETQLSLPLMVAPVSLPPSPSSAVTWPSFRSSLPEETSARICSTLWGAARKSSRRCSSVTRLAIGCRLSVQSSARVAAADDQQFLVAELLHLAHGVEHRGAFIGLDARHRRPLRLERAAAGGDHHDLALEHLAGVGGDAEKRDRRSSRPSPPSRSDGRSGRTA